MRVIEVGIEQRRNEMAGETGDPRENPPTNDIVRHDYLPPYPVPEESIDLTPLDFYSWGHLKALVYATPVDDVDTLRNRIVVGCETIRNFPGIHQRFRPIGSGQRRRDRGATSDELDNLAAASSCETPRIGPGGGGVESCRRRDPGRGAKLSAWEEQARRWESGSDKVENREQRGCRSKQQVLCDEVLFRQIKDPSPVARSPHEVADLGPPGLHDSSGRVVS
ncbi:hypothetical protein PR048_004331 [Dryococelus australis]|uniref:Uncharacterized protein n=1 Tax=Dryococelus australis TaxID=614101 RepID=A0ABQ9I553_9NEOP|nr:hypothetical protein PR048_004331 [Dryococelus australis]